MQSKPASSTNNPNQIRPNSRINKINLTIRINGADQTHSGKEDDYPQQHLTPCILLTAHANTPSIPW
jgi:hypothetical protein